MASNDYNASDKPIKKTKSVRPPKDQEALTGESNTGKQKLDDQYRELIATEAYFNAERRGFQSGKELDDWLEAERLVKNRLAEAAATNNSTKSKSTKTQKAKDELSRRELSKKDNMQSETTGQALEDNGVNLPKNPPHWSQGG